MLALVKYKARPSHEKYCRTKLPASSPNSSHSMQRQGESFLGRKWLIGKKIKKELDKPEGISHAKMV